MALKGKGFAKPARPASSDMARDFGQKHSQPLKK
jgi:hypothetical protein